MECWTELQTLSCKLLLRNLEGSFLRSVICRFYIIFLVLTLIWGYKTYHWVTCLIRGQIWDYPEDAKRRVIFFALQGILDSRDRHFLSPFVIWRCLGDLSFYGFIFSDEPEMVEYLSWDWLATMSFRNICFEILWSLLYGLASYMIILQV